MAAKLWQVATSNAFNTTLNGNITDTDETLTLTTVVGLVAPGVIVIDRVDANNTATPAVREYISFSAIDGNDLTGLGRHLGGSTAQAHSSGAKVEEVFSITHWKDLVSFLEVSHASDGKIVAGLATIDQARIITHLNASGASISGNFPLHPTWFISGLLSLATSGAGSPASMPQKGVWQFFSAVLRTPASGSTLVLDVNKNFTSIFEAETRLMIPAGGTYISTASISDKFFASGDVFSVDIDQGGGLAEDVTISARSS